MRHVHGEVGMSVEHAGIDQPDRRHDQREFASDRAGGVETIELLRIIQLQRRMDEHEHAETRDFGPERLELWVVEKQPVGLRGDHHALKSELVLTAVELLHGVRAAKRMCMSCADEAAGIILLCLLGLAVDEARGLEIRAHALRTREPGSVDAGQVHHFDVLVEIVQQRMNGVTRRALCIVVQDQSIAWVLLDQLARREVVLEVDDHFTAFHYSMMPVVMRMHAKTTRSRSSCLTSEAIPTAGTALPQGSTTTADNPRPRCATVSRPRPDTVSRSGPSAQARP